MVLTQSFKELAQKRVVSDAACGDLALLHEGIDTMFAGDVDTAKALLRDYIKATVGFEKLGDASLRPRSPVYAMLRRRIRRNISA